MPVAVLNGNASEQTPQSAPQEPQSQQGQPEQQPQLPGMQDQPLLRNALPALEISPDAEFPHHGHGRRLAYNPAFAEKLTHAELEGVLAHEVMHCALAHHCRRAVSWTHNSGIGPQIMR
jgi:Zn-dependent protease with chaperone function